MRRVDRLLVGVAVPSVALAAWDLAGAPGAASRPDLRIAVESLQGFAAALVAFLVYGRFRRTRQVGDGLLHLAFLGFGAGSLASVLHLAIHEGEPFGTGFTWSRLLLRVAASVALAAAALLGPGRVGDGWATRTLVACAAVAVAVAGLAAAGDALPEPLASRSAFDAHPLLAVGLAAVATGWACAVLGFRRRSLHDGDPLVLALAVASLVFTCSWATFVARPTLFTDRVHLGDVLRLAGWGVVLVGAAAEVARYWRRERALAVAEERRRLARDLHDGLAQELSFIAQQSRLLVDGDAPPDAHSQVASAAQRALDEARRAISALREDHDEPLGVALAKAAEDAAARVGTAVEVAVDPAVAVDPDTREALVRIVREAVSNAGRHGEAALVEVRLDADRVLRVVDDGRGMPAEPRADGRFGLVTMRERAEGVGARLRIGAGRGGSGTAVEVSLP